MPYEEFDNTESTIAQTDNSENSSLTYSSVMESEVPNDTLNGSNVPDSTMDQFGKLEIVDSGVGNSDGDQPLTPKSVESGDKPVEGADGAPAAESDSWRIQRDDQGRITSEYTPGGQRNYKYSGESSTLAEVEMIDNDGNKQVYKRDANGNFVSKNPDGSKKELSDITVNQQTGDTSFKEMNGEKYVQKPNGTNQRFDQQGRISFESNPNDQTVTTWDQEKNEKTVWNQDTGEKKQTAIPEKEKRGYPIDRAVRNPEG